MGTIARDEWQTAIDSIRTPIDRMFGYLEHLMALPEPDEQDLERIKALHWTLDVAATELYKAYKNFIHERERLEG